MYMEIRVCKHSIQNKNYLKNVFIVEEWTQITRSSLPKNWPNRLRSVEKSKEYSTENIQHKSSIKFFSLSSYSN